MPWGNSVEHRVQDWTQRNLHGPEGFDRERSSLLHDRNDTYDRTNFSDTFFDTFATGVDSCRRSERGPPFGGHVDAQTPTWAMFTTKIGGGFAHRVNGSWTIVAGPSTSLECANPPTRIPSAVYVAFGFTTCP